MFHHNRFSLQFDELGPISEGELSMDVSKSAAVLVVIANPGHEPEIIYTRRADHLSSHSGQVSFPGGRWEADDGDLSITALRETEEEIGLPRSAVELKGTLKRRNSRFGLDVLPYVGVLPESVELVPNPDEIASIFHVPLRYFAENPPDRIDLLHRHDVRIASPAWNFEGYDIWGLTAMFTSDLLHRLGIVIDLKDVPREKRGSGDD